MHEKPRPRGRGKGLVYVLSAAVLLAVVLSGGRPDFDPPRVAGFDCGADISHPLQVRVVPRGPIAPGALVTASVEIEARFPLDGVSIRVLPPPGVQLLSTPRGRVGIMAAGDSRQETLTLIAPPGPERKTVEVQVEGFLDGTRVTRGAVLNLVFEEEPFRMVTAPDGQVVREVRARRVDG